MLSAGAKFGLATIMLAFIVLSGCVQFACIQTWRRCFPYKIAWWDVFEPGLWSVFVFEIGVASLALGRWLMLLCDLWGEAGRKVLPIREYFLLLAVVIVIFVPPMMLVMGFQAGREWFRNRSTVEKDEVATSLETEGVPLMGDSGAKLA